MAFLKQYWWVLLIIIGIGLGVWVYMSKQDDKLLTTEPTAATPELKKAVEKKLGAEYLAKKGSTRSYQAALDALFSAWSKDPNQFKEWGITKGFATYKDAKGKPNFAEAIKPRIEEWASNSL